MAKRPKRDIYQEVTDRIIELLEQGTVPWKNPIANTGGGWPTNSHSGKAYRGVNTFLLAAMSWANGYSSDYWLTFRQAKQRGGQVRKGEKSSLVIFWKQFTSDDRETGEEITIPMLKHYNVFNVEQCDGIKTPATIEPDADAPPFEPLLAAEEIIRGYKNAPSIIHGGPRALYRPSSDEIAIPEPERFDAREDYYCTLFHECVHSTGHSKRLDRGLDTDTAPFGSREYSKEELVAEMGAAFLSASAGISPPTINQSASYINGWMKRLKGDKKLVVQAASAAQRGADLILGTQFGDPESSAETQPASQTSKPGTSDPQPSLERPATNTVTSTPVPSTEGGQLDLF